MDYLDEHIDVLYQAAERAIDRLYDRSADSVQKAAAAREKLSGGLAGKLGEPQALEEAFIRRIVQRVITEQEADKTRLFQVSIKLSVETPIRDLEGKLNRIRAIEGVTVVGHETAAGPIGTGNVLARIKFRPRQDLQRPMTYVTQILAPAINSSRVVPGVKIAEIVRGTLKEL